MPSSRDPASPSAGARETSLLGPRYDLAEPPAWLRPDQLEARAEHLEALAAGRFEFEDVPCDCGAGDPGVALALVDRFGIPCRTALCMRCGLARITPRMSARDYGTFYSGPYRRLYRKREGGPAEMVAAGVSGTRGEELRRHLERHLDVASMRVVEIGAGGGWNLARLREAGARAVVGWDFDEEFLAAGRAHGLDLRAGGTSEAAAAATREGRFDLLVLSHVVEHMLDPVAELRTARDLLAPGGVVYVEVPGLFEAPREKRDPMYVLQLAHVRQFCLATLEATMREAGYRPLRAAPRGARWWRRMLRGPGRGAVWGDERVRSLWEPDGEAPGGGIGRGAGRPASPELAIRVREALLRCEADRLAEVAGRSKSKSKPPCMN